MTERPERRRDIRAARKRQRRRAAVRDITLLVVLSVAAVLLVQGFVVRSFYVPSESMEPTLHVQDRILTDKLTPAFTGYKPGDIIVFHDPNQWLGVDDSYLVKRVIAVGGDTIVGLTDGTVTVNGTQIDQPWADVTSQQPFTATIPEGEVWVEGDNRRNSSDSRFHGTVPLQDIEGRVIWVYWPLSSWGAR